MATRRKRITLTDEQRTLVEDNIRLAYWYAHQMKWIPLELEERISVALLGLTKAAERYDPERGTSFATYARKVMCYEILTGFRKENKHANVISLNLPVGDDDHWGALEDLVPDKKNCFEESETVLDATATLGRMESQLQGKKKQVFLELLKHPGETQEFYADRAGVSQSQVSRYLRDIRNIVEEDLAC